MLHVEYDFQTYVRGGSSLCKCGQPRRPGQRNCTGCHAGYLRKWRKRKGGYSAFTAEQKLRANARSMLHVYVKRGKVVKPSTCTVPGCQRPPQAHHDDYRKPLDVHWICRPHHLQLHSTGL